MPAELYQRMVDALSVGKWPDGREVTDAQREQTMEAEDNVMNVSDLLGDDEDSARAAADVLRTQVFLYEADMARLAEAHQGGNTLVTEVLQSYANAEFFTELPNIDEEIEVVTFVAGVGDISTDLLSPGADAHSRSDRELHGQSMFEHNREQQQALLDLQAAHPD